VGHNLDFFLACIRAEKRTVALAFSSPLLLKFYPPFGIYGFCFYAHQTLRKWFVIREIFKIDDA
jgi:hypothetical protein